jgi:hypothetical protein
MLLMIRTQAAIIRASIFDRRIKFQRHLPRLQRLPTQLVIFHIRANQHLLQPMLRTPLVHINTIILKNDFCFDFSITVRADAVGQFVEDVGAVRHGFIQQKLENDQSRGLQPGVVCCN